MPCRVRPRALEPQRAAPVWPPSLPVNSSPEGASLSYALLPPLQPALPAQASLIWIAGIRGAVLAGSRVQPLVQLRLATDVARPALQAIAARSAAAAIAADRVAVSIVTARLTAAR